MKRVIIIGAGMAGLTAGFYAAKNGFDTTIFEAHSLPGGLCAGWWRSGYYFEGCFHYIRLLGMAKTSMFHGLWKDLGVLEKIRLVSQDYIQAFRDGSGRELRVFVDPERLRQELTRLSPRDAKRASELCRAIRSCYWFTHTAGLNPLKLAMKLVNIAAALRFLFKYGSLSLKEYAANFNDPLIRRALESMFDYDEISCVQLPMFLGLYRGEGVNFPAGGSLALAKVVADTATCAGAKIVYRTAVSEIIKSDGRASGVRLADGSIHDADIVISASDGYSTLFRLLAGSYIPPRYSDLYARQPVYTAFIQVSLGLSMEVGQLPSVLRQKTAKPFFIAGEQRDEICLAHYGYDSSISGNGKDSLVVLYKTDFDWWKSIEYHSPEYKEAKDSILRTTLGVLEEFLPGITSKVAVSDISTPYTTIRYTGNYRAGLGFIPTVTYMQELRSPRFTLDSLDNFYMAGQWVSGMGVPNAAMSGKRVIQEICKSERVLFASR